MHYTGESDSMVCITPPSQALLCASHCGVKWWTVLKKLRGVHLAAESITYQVSALIRSFTNAIFLWCQRYSYKIDTVSHKWSKESFLLQKFFEKMKLKDVASMKTRKIDIFESVWLCCVHPTAESSGMHHTAESRSPKFSKNLAVRRTSVKIKIIASHWVP